MKPLFLCYAKCSTCKKAAQWLVDNNIDVESRSITDENPTYEELSKWLQMSGLPIRRFFNTSGIKYREMGLKERVANDSTEELLRLLATDGMLVKRPLLITSEGVVVTGFKESDYAEATMSLRG